MLDLVDALAPHAAASFEPDMAPERPGEVRHIALDAARAKGELGWEAEVGSTTGSSGRSRRCARLALEPERVALRAARGGVAGAGAGAGVGAGAGAGVGVGAGADRAPECVGATGASGSTRAGRGRALHVSGSGVPVALAERASS